MLVITTTYLFLNCFTQYDIQRLDKLLIYCDINHIPIDCKTKMLKSSSITNSTIMGSWQYRICDKWIICDYSQSNPLYFLQYASH